MKIWFDTEKIFCLGGCTFYEPFTQAWKTFILKGNKDGICGYCKVFTVDTNEWYEQEHQFNFKPGYQLILKDEN